MKNSGRWLAALMLALLLGCSSVTKDIQVETVADPGTDFSSYRTYAWVAASAIVNDPYAQWAGPGFDVAAEVMKQVDDELEKRGMTQDSTNPDLLVAVGAGVDMEALGVKEDPDTKTDILANIPQGSLVLAMMDNATGYLAWVGVAEGNIPDTPDDKTVKKRIDYAVSQMLKQMPK